MAKSIKCIAKQWAHVDDAKWATTSWVSIRWLNGKLFMTVPYLKFVRNFGIKFNSGEKKRVKITIEEIT